jgi:hypothetical protein
VVQEMDSKKEKIKWETASRWMRNPM